MKKATFVICFFATILFAQAQTIRYVRPTVAGAETGDSWDNASSNIQAMIDAVAGAGGGQVWIACGTYPLTATLQMKEKVNVYGGFFGNESSINDRAKSDLDNNGIIEPWEFTFATVLDGQDARQVLNQASAFTVETVWDGVTVTKGKANSGHGGGVYIEGKGKLINCIVSKNTTSVTPFSSGGGIYNRGGTVSNCMVSENTAISNSSAALGGGIYNIFGGTITNCIVSRNTVSNTSYTGSVHAGGIYNELYGTITNCIVSGNIVSDNYSSRSSAGGIYNKGTISNCIISGNTVFYDRSSRAEGGGVYNDEGIIKDCTVSGNTVKATTAFLSITVRGGGIYNNKGKINNCTVNENEVSIAYTSIYGVWAAGGGISNENGTIDNCTVSKNTITVTTTTENTGLAHGGGIYGENGTIDDCTVSKNTITVTTMTENTGLAYGGGIFCSNGETIITNCMVSENTVSAYSARGGGIYMGNIIRCIIKGNSSNYGGGLCRSVATNSLLLNNNASYGGGGCESTSVNCSFVGNIATSEGGGIYGYTLPSTATNCIFWQNTAPVGTQVYDDDASVTYSAIQGGFTGQGNISITQDNETGGPLFVNPAAGNYQLQPGSPCINKGSNAAVAADMTTDLTGNPRIFGGTVDMGAYEWQGPSRILNMPTDDSSIIVYSNPASTELHVKLASRSQETVSYVIYNSTGQMVMQGRLHDAPINIQSFAKGVYYLKITSKENATVKFIKN